MTTFTIQFIDGTTKTAQILLADQIKFELNACRKGWGTYEENPVIFGSFVTWAALTRTGQIDMTWDAYNEMVATITEGSLTDDSEVF